MCTFVCTAKSKTSTGIHEIQEANSDILYVHSDHPETGIEGENYTIHV